MADEKKEKNTGPKLFLTKVLGDQVYTSTTSRENEEAAALEKGVGYALLGEGEDRPLRTKRVTLRCPECGCSKEAFEKSGRFGCAYCYETFGPYIGGLLKKMHTGTRHLGKIPSKSLSPKLIRERIDQLREEMDTVVRKENYEEAGRIRDEVRMLEKRLAALPVSS